jgi:hypothetical protein
MGVDLAGALAVMGTVWVGNPVSLNPGFSIGGKTSESENILGNLLGLLSTFHLSVSAFNLLLTLVPSYRYASRLG